MHKKTSQRRNIKEENVALIIRYFCRDNLQSTSPGTILMREFALAYKYQSLDTKTNIEKRRQIAQRLLQHNIEINSPPEIIKRFENMVESSYLRIPIEQEMIKELEEKVSVLTSEEYTRCMNWVKQTRKRKSDKYTDSEKKTITISKTLYDELQEIKLLDSALTWDNLLSKMIEKYTQKN